MGYLHMNKAFKFQLPSPTRFVLLALCRYADNDKDTSFPGIAKLSDMTGYNEKTIVRHIRVLKSLGIIESKKNPSGPNNIYTLFMTGDIKAWDGYLKSKAEEIKSINKENQSSSITSKSIYNISNKSKTNKEEKNKIELACDGSHALKSSLNLSSSVGESILNIPPGKRITSLQRHWEETVAKHFKGLKVVISPTDRWAIDLLYEKYETQLPLFEFIEFCVAEWSYVAGILRTDESRKTAKQIPNIPSLSFVSLYHEFVVHLFWKNKEV